MPSGFEGRFGIEGRCQLNYGEEIVDNQNFSLSDSTNIIRFLQVFNDFNSTLAYEDDIYTDFGFVFSIISML